MTASNADTPRPLDRFERQLIRRLVFEPERLSRNRNFFAFDDPTMRRLRRIASLLRALRRELASVDEDLVTVRQDGGFVVVTVRRPEAAARHVARVAPDELEVIREDERVRLCLDRAAARGAAATPATEAGYGDAT